MRYNRPSVGWYYNMKFVSPLDLYAEVKEEMRSYFDTGAVDDLMFPKWTEQCLKKFRKSSFPIKEIVLPLENFQSSLPDDFNSVRELWAITLTKTNPFWGPNWYYKPTDCRISVDQDSCTDCNNASNSSITDLNLELNLANNQQFLVVEKSTGVHQFSFTQAFLLSPGNLNASKYCHDSLNLKSSSKEQFDIRDGKIVTDYECGHLHLVYYAEAQDEEGDQLVPDDFWVQDYIRKNLIYKTFRQLSNQVVDETFNQVERKLDRAEREQSEAFIMAEIELKKLTIEQINQSIKRSYNRNNKYRL